jgi:type IV pilus assembly protein PilM
VAEGKPNPLDQIKDLISQMQQLGNTNVVGLDIGSSSIKVCELSGSKGKYKLQKFGLVKLADDVFIEDQLEKPEVVVEAIKEAFKQAGITNQGVAIGLYGPNTICKRLPMPSGTPQEIEDQVMWESEQYIPFGADVSSIGHQILGENEGGGVDVFISAAREDLIEKYQGLATEAGLKTKVVDLAMITLSNVFEHSMFDKIDNYAAGTLVMDIGAQTTKMLVYKNGAPVYSREINFGGKVISEEIQRQMGVSYDEAEDLKIHGDESGNLPEEILQISSSSIQNLFSEVKKALNFYLSTNTEDKIEYAFITGGTSRLPGIKEGIEKLLEVPTDYLNPIRRIDLDGKISNQVRELIPVLGSVAIGLSMRRP